MDLVRRSTAKRVKCAAPALYIVLRTSLSGGELTCIACTLCLLAQTPFVSLLLFLSLLLLVLLLLYYCSCRRYRHSKHKLCLATRFLTAHISCARQSLRFSARLGHFPAALTQKAPKEGLAGLVFCCDTWPSAHRPSQYC